jgi:hypothetical protein
MRKALRWPGPRGLPRREEPTIPLDQENVVHLRPHVAAPAAVPCESAYSSASPLGVGPGLSSTMVLTRRRRSFRSGAQHLAQKTNDNGFRRDRPTANLVVHESVYERPAGAAPEEGGFLCNHADGKEMTAWSWWDDRGTVILDRGPADGPVTPRWRASRLPEGKDLPDREIGQVRMEHVFPHDKLGTMLAFFVVIRASSKPPSRHGPQDLRTGRQGQHSCGISLSTSTISSACPGGRGEP